MVDPDGIAALLHGVSQLVTEFPAIREFDINPVIAGPDSVLAVGFRAAIEREPPVIPTVG